MIKVTYLGHSGFYVETDKAEFLFDYYKGHLPETDPSRKLFVFVSHAHYDHFNKDIFRLYNNSESVYFILSSDTKQAGAHEGKHIIFMEPGEEKKIFDCCIRTLRSNDEGVAFLIHYRGHTFYHGGDLNWWHWEGEPDEYNVHMRRSYQHEINKLQYEKIDIAFLPVDPRLGEQYCWGLDCFMKRTDTARVFPMHFWENYSIIDRLIAEDCTAGYRDRIMKIKREGQTFLFKE